MIRRIAGGVLFAWALSASVVSLALVFLLGNDDDWEVEL